MNDSELLHAWASRRDETAFAELVRRHLGMVHASARRQVGASPLADDVAQAVFLVLARKAGSLGPCVVLSGWLFRTTRFVAARALRAEQRRSHHESLATMQPAAAEAAPAPEHWKDVEPHLDGALASLSVADRDAVMLRYFEGKPLRTVGERLGVNEETAKKRVSRAVDKLRAWLSGHGVVLTAAGLATLLANLPASAAPMGLAAQITGAATANTAGAAALSLAAGAIRDWWLAQVRRVLPWAAAALLLTVGSAVARRHHIATATAGKTVEGGVEQVPVAAVASPAPSKSGATAAQPGPSKILLSIRSAVDRRPVVAAVGVSIWGKRKRLETRDYQADANGVVEIPVMESDAGTASVAVFVSAPGFVPKTMDWKRHEFVEPVLFHECLLDPGRVLEGIVQDEAGNPVADAKVFFRGPGSNMAERESISFTPRMTSVTSDARGRFRTDQIPMLRGNDANMGYVVVHPDYVRGAGSLDGPASLATNHVVVLRRGERIIGRIEDSNGARVANATVEESGYYAGGERKTTSGPDGRFSAGPFAKETVRLEFSAEGFKTLEQGISNSDSDVVVRLLPLDGSLTDWERGIEGEQTVRLTGTVVDDEAGQPLSKFRVRLNEHRGTSISFLGEGHDGHFDWPVDMAFFREFSLEADSEGYEAVASDVRPVQNGVQSFAFRLKRGGFASGRVVDSTGNPVVGAVVGLNGLGFGFIVRDNRTFSGNDAPQAITDADGLFSIRLRLNTESLVIVHEAGFAQVPVAQAKRATIALRSWGAIEGVVLTAGRPVASQRVILQTWISEEDPGLKAVSLDNTTSTDAQGRFRFDHVPAGTVALSRYYKFSPGETGVTGIGPRQRVDVPAGGMVEVTLASTGRALTGRLALSQTVPGYDWRWDLQKLEEVHAVFPMIRPEEYGTPESFRRLRAEAIQRAAVCSFYPEIRPDGSFRMDDVPAGNYIFELRVSVPPTDSGDEQQTFFRPELGALKIPVNVPAGDFNDPPLDLGAITIPVKKP